MSSLAAFASASLSVCAGTKCMTAVSTVTVVSASASACGAVLVDSARLVAVGHAFVGVGIAACLSTSGGGTALTSNVSVTARSLLSPLGSPTGMGSSDGACGYAVGSVECAMLPVVASVAVALVLTTVRN